MKRFKLTLCAACALVASGAMATDVALTDGVTARVSGTATLGTLVRAADPDPANYGLLPSTMVTGAAPGQYIGQTGGSDLNYTKGKPVSTVLKALVDLDVHGRNLGLFVRASAWHDFVLGHDDELYGNYPNGFTPNKPLSDAGFAAQARFSNATLRDVYLYGKFDGPNQEKVEVRAGRQVLNWGVSQFFPGGISLGTNPYDLAGQLRPGALPQEGRVPLGMLSLNIASGQAWGFEGFVPYESATAALPGCGSFFDTASIIQPGCNFTAALGAPVAGTPFATLASLTEQSVLASGYYVHRNADALASPAGQLGLSLRYALADWNTELRGYAMNTNHSLANLYRVTVENVNGATLPAGLAGGLARLINPNGLKYGVVYPGGVHLYGLSLDTKLDATTRLFGEFAYRPNQPLGMGGTDLLTGFLLRAPTSLLALQKNILAIPAGGTFDGFDRYGVTTADVGLNKVFPKALGADRVVVAAELGTSQVQDLPDPAQMRYGRGLAFGAAPYLVNGVLTACAETSPGLNGVPGKTCTSDGFVSGSAWGLRGRLAATYGNALAGAALTPSLYLAKDIKGYSYDATFSEGRLVARLGLRADWGQKYFGEFAYTHMAEGRYNLAADRSNWSLVAGVNF
jgi:hypothetical protein